MDQTLSKPRGSTAKRGEPVRQRVLDAAERLLRCGEADFSMRDLAASAQVSFATPFNQFGGKSGVMHALSRRRVEAMGARLVAKPQPVDAAGRISLAVETAVEVMLEEPVVNRVVMGWIGTPEPATGDALSRSTAFWSLALGDGSIEESRLTAGAIELSRQLAIAFRGTLSFWAARELGDEALGPTALAMATTLLDAVGKRRP